MTNDKYNTYYIFLVNRFMKKKEKKEKKILKTSLLFKNFIFLYVIYNNFIYSFCIVFV